MVWVGCWVCVGGSWSPATPKATPDALQDVKTLLVAHPLGMVFVIIVLVCFFVFSRMPPNLHFGFVAQFGTHVRRHLVRCLEKAGRSDFCDSSDTEVEHLKCSLVASQLGTQEASGYFVEVGALGTFILCLGTFHVNLCSFVR